MNTLSPFLTLNYSCDAALQWTQVQLSRAGLRSMRTFDLHTARHALADCPCPHHGSEACDCQMVVVLVYGNVEQPVTLFLHGKDGQTWLSLADEPRQRADSKLLAGIRQALTAPLSIPQNG